MLCYESYEGCGVLVVYVFGFSSGLYYYYYYYSSLTSFFSLKGYIRRVGFLGL